MMTLSWTNPEFTTEGLTRMRLMCYYDDEINDPCNIGFYGEVEDYSAILVKSNDMYCDPYFGRGNTDGDYISAFQLNEVNLTDIGAEITSFYNDFTSSVAEATQG